ncbi:Acetylornithine/succinyldiaminopimelate aminotransferase [subsurface metagenome]
MIEGYNSIFPLMEGEIELLYNLICMRLCQSVTFSAYQQTLEPENEYLKISENKAWESLFKLRGINPNYAQYAFRKACNLDPHPYVNELVELLETNQNQIYPILKDEISTKSHMVFDLSIGSLEIDTFEGLIDEKQVIAHIYRSLKEAKKEIGIGRYNEARIYKIKTQTNTFDNPTIHLGIDLFLKPKTPIYAPFEGTLTSIKQDKSPTNTIYAIILEHLIGDKKLKFFTLYKNLDGETAKELQLGKKINKGELLGYVRKIENFAIPLSYVHFQISVDLLDDVDSFPSSINAHKKKLWLSLCPDPNVLLKIPQKSFPSIPLKSDRILEIREKQLGKSLSISYQTPLKIVKGYMQYLFDQNGFSYLDAVNNVPHVGHCHPEVTRALHRQASVLNTNSRYLHDNIVKYAEELCKMLPEPLNVCFFVNSGSEANELALRLARTHTNQHDVIVLDYAYHGITGELVNISPYKHNGPGGKGAPSYVHTADMPDLYRGVYKIDDPDAGKKYAAQINSLLSDIKEKGKGIAAFISESLPGVGGQIMFPDNYLREVYASIRKNGGVCIADEVQVGFGRVGSRFWGFELQNVIP